MNKENIMGSTLSLMSLIKDDPILSRRLEKQTQKVKKHKEDLSKVAESYNQKFNREIREGTRRKQLLLEDGKRKGLSEEDTMKKYGKFIPSVYTPLLNFLYFFMKEHEDNSFELLREKFDKKYGKLIHEEIERENIPEFDTFVYGNVTSDTFQKIKKLKALSKSKNINEAFLAYTTCLKLCEKYNLDFDKIPSTYE